MQCTHQQMRKCVSPRLNVGILPIITMAQVPQAVCSAILSLFLEPFQGENSHCEKLALTPLPRIPTLAIDLLHWCPRASQISISSWHLLDALLQPASPHLLAHSSPRPRSQGRTLLTDHIRRIAGFVSSCMLSSGTSQLSKEDGDLFVAVILQQAHDVPVGFVGHNHGMQLLIFSPL